MLTRAVQGGPIRTGAELEAVQGIASAAQSGDVDALRQHLDARPDLINALAGRGFPKPTALHLAALRYQHEAVRLLIARGADLDINRHLIRWQLSRGRKRGFFLNIPTQTASSLSLRRVSEDALNTLMARTTRSGSA